jgi:hypothetical protein
LITHPLRQVHQAPHLVEADRWEQLSGALDKGCPRLYKRANRLRPCIKRTSGLLLASGVADDEQLAHKRTGEIPAWINEPAVAESQLGVITAMEHLTHNCRPMHYMKRNITLTLVALALAVTVHIAFGLSRSLPQPEIFFPKSYDSNRAEQVHSVLRADTFKYLGGLVSYWEPEWSTTLVYDGNAQSLAAFLAALNGVKGITLRLTFSSDLSKETGSALQAGSWWVMYSHTVPDTITVRINLAAESLGRDKFELRLPKARP